MNPKKPDQAAEKRAKFFETCAFYTSVGMLRQLPEEDRPEIAFAGRSNVGKSSLMNALTNKRTLARMSHTPGRTQLLNYFTLSDKAYLVDMPGYGYAKVSKSKAAEWTRLIEDYLRGRRNLARVMLLIDARHGIKDNDKITMNFLDRLAVPYQPVLTKLDKVKLDQHQELFEKTEAELSSHSAAFPGLIATSSVNDSGIDLLRQTVISAMKLDSLLA